MTGTRSETDENQETLTEYSTESADETVWQCQVCGATSTDKHTIETCHPLYVHACQKQSNTFQDGSITNLVYPLPMKDKYTNVMYYVRHDLAACDDTATLHATAEHLLEYTDVCEPPVQSEALALFTILTWLQGSGALPEYPRYTATIRDSDTPTPIQTFVTEYDAVTGDVSDAVLSESPFLTRDRVYRSKVWSVTEQYWHGLKDPVTGQTAVFGDGAAHYAVVGEGCAWLEQHPSISWTSAPFVLPPPVDSTGVEIGPAQADWNDTPVWLFDFAAFTDEHEVGALGTVVSDDTPDEIWTQIRRMNAVDKDGVVVMPSRQALHAFLRERARAGYLDGYSTPPGQYSRLPSLEAVNEVAQADFDALSNINFATRKQLIDGDPAIKTDEETGDGS